MKKAPASRLKIAILAAALALGFAASSARAGYTTYDYPDAWNTTIQGKSGDTFFGSYRTDSGFNSFVFDGSSYTPVALYPGSSYTYLLGISGQTILGNAVMAGTFNNVRFLYDTAAKTYTPLNLSGLTPSGISGHFLFGGGYYNSSTQATDGFVYDTLTSSLLGSYAVPGAISTSVMGVSASGDTVAGMYFGSAGGVYGFSYSDGSYTTLSIPGSRSINVLGISGDTIFGTTNIDGVNSLFLYTDGVITLPTVSIDGATSVSVAGLDGDQLYGSYTDSEGVIHGFVSDIEAVPEPQTYALAVMGLAALAGYRRFARCRAM